MFVSNWFRIGVGGGIRGVLRCIRGPTHCTNNRLGDIVGGGSRVSLQCTFYFPSVCRVNVDRLKVGVLCSLMGDESSS